MFFNPRIAHGLGARVLLATNAAGGIHANLRPGSLMMVTDHILWNVPRMWQQSGPGCLGEPRVSHYSARLLQLLTKAGGAVGRIYSTGIYASPTGPCFETAGRDSSPASIGRGCRWHVHRSRGGSGRRARHECAVVSCITNKAAGLSDGRLIDEEVLSVASRSPAWWGS